MFFLILILFSAGIVAADQFSKYLTVTNLAPFNAEPAQLEILKEVYHLTDAQIAGMPYHADAIPGLFQFSHAFNDGAAFSILEGQQWLFALIFVLLTVAIVWIYCKKTFPFSKFEWICIAAIYGGGLGNMIDRLRLGYVIDMIETQFISFPIFNVADSFITCGCIALMISLIFFNKAFWKDDKK